MQLSWNSPCSSQRNDKVNWKSAKQQTPDKPPVQQTLVYEAGNLWTMKQMECECASYI